MFEKITVEESLQLLDALDRGDNIIKPVQVRINQAPETRVLFKGYQIEVNTAAGRRPGLALDGRKGGVLVRRGHAVGRWIRLDRQGGLRFYWITDAGRTAARTASSQLVPGTGA